MGILCVRGGGTATFYSFWGRQTTVTRHHSSDQTCDASQAWGVLIGQLFRSDPTFDPLKTNLLPLYC